jgi:hypothetical protein
VGAFGVAAFEVPGQFAVFGALGFDEEVAALVRGEVVQVGGDAIDEPADPGDLFGRWGCLGSGPVVDIGAVRRFSLLRSRSSR